MTEWQAAILGFVQGATEFLPISSSAHIWLADRLMFGTDSGAAFTAVIQWGTLLSAVLYFRKDIFAILFKPRSMSGETGADRRLLLPIAAGTLPIVAAGLLFKDQIKNDLRSGVVIAGSMIFFALILAAAERSHRATKQIADLGLKEGLIVGIAQMFALIPGASRSGTTITGALFGGIERETAARFSFLLSLPAIFGAGVFELREMLKDQAHPLSSAQARPLIIATIVAFVVGYASIGWLLKFLRRSPTYVFVIYRLVVGGLLLAAALSGNLK